MNVDLVDVSRTGLNVSVLGSFAVPWVAVVTQMFIVQCMRKVASVLP